MDGATSCTITITTIAVFFETFFYHLVLLIPGFHDAIMLIDHVKHHLLIDPWAFGPHGSNKHEYIDGTM